MPTPASLASSARPRVLVSRTDRIGDVVLSLPLCGLLRERLDAHVTFLGAPYTRAVLEASDVVDEVMEWDEAAGADAQRALVESARADVVLHVFPRPSVAAAAWRAGVAQRVGTSHRLYHWLYCNRLESLGRKRSALHEAQLDVRLARGLLGDEAVALTPDALAPYARLTPRVGVPAPVASLLGGDRFTLVLHPRSLGSAREWPLDRYRALVDALPPDRFRVLVTGRREEGDELRGWLATLPPHAHDVTGRLTLAELIAVLAAADGAIACSTGPLHVAAALGTPTLGLYPRTPPMHPGRWSPLGERAETLVPAPGAEDDGAGERASLEIPVAAVLERVMAWAAVGATRTAAG